jgi:hypothetical protein
MQGRRVVFGLTVLNLILAAWSLARPTRAAGPGDDIETVRARAIELLDASGQVRAQMNVEQGGEVVLRLRDAKGDIRVKLGAGADGSGLLLLDGSTEPGIQMLAKESGASLTLAHKDQRRVITP